MSESGPDSSPARAVSRSAVQPLTLELLMSAVTALCEHDRKGASVHAIKQYLLDQNIPDNNRFKFNLKKTLAKGMDTGVLMRPGSKENPNEGASLVGRYKINKVKIATDARKTREKKKTAADKLKKAAAKKKTEGATKKKSVENGDVRKKSKERKSDKSEDRKQMKKVKSKKVDKAPKRPSQEGSKKRHVTKSPVAKKLKLVKTPQKQPSKEKKDKKVKNDKKEKKAQQSKSKKSSSAEYN